VRAALGAGRGRLVVQMLSESLVLAGLGGAAGIGLSALLLNALPLVMPDRLSVVGIGDIGLDARVLLFAAGLSLATGLVFGILPALIASRPALAALLATGGRGAAGVRHAARRALVISEMALAALTLVGAGLAIRSFSTILAQPLGFDAVNRLTMTISIPVARYETADERVRALAGLETRLGGVAGVRSVGAITLLPLSGSDGRAGVEIEGRETQEGDPPTRMHPRVVTPGYFRTMSIPIVRGRGFADDDGTGRDPVVIVSQTSASRYWPGLDPVGRRMRFVGDDTWRTVVGVAADVRHWGLTRPVNPMVYRPLAQAGTNFLTFVVDSRTDAASLTPVIRQAVAEFDANLPLGNVQTMEQLVARSVRSERAQMLLMGTFGALALLLAVIGIYGVTSQLVVTRRHEIGVRMTLGARPLDILRHLLGEGLSQAAAGLVVGLAGGVWLMQLASSLLYGVQPWDPLTLAAVSAVLLLSSMAAIWIPSRRAMAVDPSVTLRSN
jgi:predicted permease